MEKNVLSESYVIVFNKYVASHLFNVSKSDILDTSCMLTSGYT